MRRTDQLQTAFRDQDNVQISRASRHMLPGKCGDIRSDFPDMHP